MVALAGEPAGCLPTAWPFATRSRLSIAPSSPSGSVPYPSRTCSPSRTDQGGDRPRLLTALPNGSISGGYFCGGRFDECVAF